MLKRTVYTAGHPAEPHAPFPNETMPARNMNGFDRLVKSIFINGPPESTVAKEILHFEYLHTFCAQK